MLSLYPPCYQVLVTTRACKAYGDFPIVHVQNQDLKRPRDGLIGEIRPASIQAAFTPFKRIFNFAYDEGLIDLNPLSSVKHPRDKRPIEERKWKIPLKVHRLLNAEEEVCGKPANGPTDERRVAIHMVVRVLASSRMRPLEVIRLTSDDVNADMITIRGSKTESSTRVITLHPELQDLPDWVANGGPDTLHCTFGVFFRSASRHQT